MAIEQNGCGRRPRAAGMALATVLLLGSGCSEEHGLRRHFNTSEPSKAATLGSDFKEAPKGQTIPPAGLGVDLVRDAAPRPLVETTYRAADD